MNQAPTTPVSTAPVTPRIWQAKVAAAVLLLGATLVGWAIDRRQFAFSYLVAWVCAISLCTGALFWVMLHHLTAAVWSVVIRRTAEHVALAVVPIAVLGIPALMNLGATHGWVDTHDFMAQRKAAYLNVPFFAIRTVMFLAVWSGLAFTLWRFSTWHDETGDNLLLRKMKVMAPVGMILLAATTTFFAFDWLMSLEWHWTSTMFGVTFWAGGIVGSLALITLLILVLRWRGVTSITEEHLHDLGKLLFGFTVFWAYVSFSQYFLIWYANLSEETPWYLHRLEGSWRGVSIAMLVGHFALPFAWLLPRSAKRTPWRLGAAAGWLFAFHLFDIYWQAMPVFHHHGVKISLFDFTASFGMLAVIVGVAMWGYSKFAPAPARDPNLAASLAHHNE